MSVIIRLQNLPWSANAMDIRQFFQGLAIPDGGVHIVGGEMGDAFIAFSTDEDARQAMMLDRGKLKETQVRLLLSSRAEMQKVIETARQTSLALMQAAAVQQQQQVPPISKLMQQAPQPPVITPTSLNKLLSQQPNENSMQSYQSFAGNQSINENSMDSRDSKDRSTDRTTGRRGRDRFGRSSRSRSKSRERRRSRSRERSGRRRRDHSRSRSHERRTRRRRSRSNDRSYDHEDNRRDRNQRDRDMGIKSDDAVIISDDNDVNMPNKDINSGMGAMGNARLWSGPQQQMPVFQTNMTKGYNTCSTNQNDVPVGSFQGNQGNSNIFNTIKQDQQQYRPQQFQQDQRLQLQQQQQQPIFSSNMHIQSSKDNNDQNKPIYNFQSFFKTNYGQSGTSTTGNNSNTSNNASKSIAFQNPYTVASMANSTNDAKPFGNSFAGMFNKNDDSKRGGTSPKDDPKGMLSPTNRNPDNKNAEINFDQLEGNCIKISNMCPSTTYSELRRFFSGLYIANNGIKMINDKHGLRIGVAFVRFVRRESKPKAFIRNGSALKSKHIVMESVTEDDFEEAVDSFKPTRRFGRYEDDKKDMMGSRMRDNNSPRRNDDPIEMEKPKFNNLYLQDVPVFAKEQDIMKMFSSYTLTDIVLTKDEENRKQLVCFVKFHRADDAKNALDETATHMIGHKKVFVSPCTDERFDRAKDKFNMQEDEDERDDDMNEDKKPPIDSIDDDNSADRNDIEESNEGSKQANEDQHTVDDNESNKKDDGNSNSNDRGAPQIPSLLGLSTCPPNDGPTDPRRRGSSRQGTRFSRPDDNQNNTNYALIKNCDYKLSKRDFIELFSSSGLVPVRVEILLNARHQPSGECICEFANSEDAEKALFKSNYYCGNRSVRIELISPAEVAKRLGDSYVQQNANNGGNNNMNMNNNFNSNFNQFGNNRSGGGGFNDNFNGNNFQSQQDSFRNNSNSMPPLQGNMGGGGGNGGGDRFNNRSNRSGRGQRQSRFSDFDDNKSSGGGNNSMGGGVGNTSMGNMSMGNNQSQQQTPQVLGDTSVDLFGQPGCVIGMENVPYKASIDDIIEFFGQYNIQPHNIIRRYNDDGTPTGDARVAFNTPMAARAALESKRQQKILNRTIFLTIV